MYNYLQDGPAPWEFPKPMLRVTITMNSRSTPELGVCLLEDAHSYAVTQGSGNPIAQGQRTVFILLKMHLLLALFFRKIQTLSAKAASPALTETFQCSSLKNAVTACMCYGQGGSHMHLMVYKNIITLKWCFRFDANTAKRVRDRFPLSYKLLLQTCIVLFTNSQFLSMIPPFQDASWCLQGCQIEGKKENKNYKFLGVWCCILQSHCFRNEMTTNWLQFGYLTTTTKKVPERSNKTN